jgi:carboxyl-terminal processing protease
MKIYKYFLFVVFAAGFFGSCSTENVEDNSPALTKQIDGNLDLEIKDFIWKGMNFWYLYKEFKPDLQDDAFTSTGDYVEYLDDWSSPEYFFEKVLKYSKDKFSWIVDDYEDLESRFAGIRKTSGANITLGRLRRESNDLVGIIRYVIPGSPADHAGLTRGMLFTQIDGQQLTVGNIDELLGPDSFTFGFAKFTNTGIETTGETAQVTKIQLTENPILISKTLDVDGIKVGYLMYNSFTHNFDGELNDAFAQFKADNVNELVLDLRYNGGGRVSTAADLASMITGQFKGEVLIRTRYNDNIESLLNETSKVTRFDDRIFDGNESDAGHESHQSAPINSLNLNKVYVIATRSSASASELIINGLAPYIDVIHVGEKTVGKVQASVTLYDADIPYYEKTNLNPDHKYAMQPLISTSVNADGEAYPEGLVPDISQTEMWDNFGILGDPTEPLLATALNEISNNRRFTDAMSKGKISPEQVSESYDDEDFYRNMYIDGLPEIDLSKFKAPSFKD